MSLPFSNPELIRNARIQLRPGRLLVGAVVAAVGLITTWESVMHADLNFSVFELKKAGAVFALILMAQTAILLIGGGIACLVAVQRERELNTFDYQRVTRLSSLKLAIGKLFGAPIAIYVAVLYLMPVALVAAAMAHLPALLVLGLYFIVLLGSLTFHAFALLISTFLGRSGGVIAAILLFLCAVYLSAVPGVYQTWAMNSLSPFFAGSMLDAYGSQTSGRYLHATAPLWRDWRDAFFGIEMPHLLVFTAIHVTLIAWFLIAIRRNLKRDPSVFETYSPVQAFLFTLYLGLLMVGFFPWKTIFVSYLLDVRGQGFKTAEADPQTVEQMLLFVSVIFFGVLALVLLRNRERTRRRIREFGDRAAGWLAALWPAPYLIAAIAVIGGAIVVLISHYRDPQKEWDSHLAVYEVAFIGAWLARDALYLQWMSLRRARRPLVTAVLYLTIFYLSVSILFSALDSYSNAGKAARTALLLPTPFFAMSALDWSQQRMIWIGALFFQAALAIVFAGLHYLRLRGFVGTARTATA